VTGGQLHEDPAGRGKEDGRAGTDDAPADETDALATGLKSGGGHDNRIGFVPRKGVMAP
jgi:hypothetical protein